MGKSPPLIPVGVLTYKRPDLLERTLSTFVDLNKLYLSRFRFFVFVQNWPDPDTLRVINFYSNLFEEVILSKTNIGAAQGTLQILERGALRYPDSPYLMILEDDWESRASLGAELDRILQFLNTTPSTGYIRLRSVNQKVSNKNPMTRQGIKYIPVNDLIYRGNMHFTTNPILLRRDILVHFRQWSPMAKESHMVQVCHYLGECGAQLRRDCFWHIGTSNRTRPWVA